MVYGIGEITYEELSPELQARIDSSSGGVSTVAGLMVIDGVFTKKVVATAEEQTEFEIPFTDYDSLNSHLDIKINSTWVNPERYSIVGNKIVLNDGVEIGTSVFFTLFHLAEPTGDGGFIEDVEMAETPQEIIVYDGEIINEKVNEAVTGHNVSGEAHTDIRELTTSINGKVEILNNDRGYLITKELRNTDLNTVTKNGMYLFNPYPTLGNTNCPLQGEDATFSMIVSGGGSTVITQLAIKGYPHTNSRMFMRGCTNGSWGEWKEIATTETTSTLDSKIGVLETERGYLTSVVINDANEIRQNGKYILSYTTLNKPDSGTDWYVCDATFEQAGTTGRLIATCYAGVNIGKTYTRINLHGTWHEWKELFSMGVYGSVTNLDDLSESGIYDIPPSTLNSPLGADYGKCLVFKNPDINAISQTAFKTSGGGTNILYIRQSYYGDGGKKWQDWQQVATTSKINNLPLLNGWYTGYNEPIVITRSGNTVCMSGIIENATISSGVISTGIPVGFRPLVSRTFMVGSATGVTSDRARIYVQKDGSITGHNLEGSTGGLVINASWEV